MRLADLHPRWVASGGDGVTSTTTGEPVPRREGVAISFDCPCGRAGERVALYINPPLDGGEPDSSHYWDRTGDTFDTLSLTPSIQRADPGGCRWHGFITNGEAKAC